MAAIAYPTPHPRQIVVRPQLRLVRGGRRPSEAVYRRRRLAAVALGAGSLVLVLSAVLVVRGSRLRRRPRSARVPRPEPSSAIPPPTGRATPARRRARSTSCSRATRSGRSPASSPPRAMCGPRSTISRRSTAARRCSRASGSSLGRRPRIDHAAPAVASPGVRCPNCSSVDDKVIDSRASDDGAIDPASPRVPGLRPAIHDVRAARGDAARRGQAIGPARVVRSREDHRWSPSGREVTADARRRPRGDRVRGRRASWSASARCRPSGSGCWCSTGCARSITSPTCGSRASTRGSTRLPTSSASSRCSRRRRRRSSTDLLGADVAQEHDAVLFEHAVQPHRPRRRRHGPRARAATKRRRRPAARASRRARRWHRRPPTGR